MMLSRIAQSICENDNFVVICHTDPDGDALGSCVALYLALKSMGKEVKMGCDTRVPSNLMACLPEMMKVELEPQMTKPYNAIAVDCGDMGRVGKLAGLFDGAENKIVIDHHGTNSGYGDLRWVIPEAAATAVLIWQLIGLLPVDPTSQMAQSCYVGVATDTGNFSFSNTDPQAFFAVSQMLGVGFDLASLSTKLFRERSIERTRVLGVCVQRLEMLCGGKVAVSGMTLEDFKKTGAADSDTEGASGFLRDIDTVEAAVFLRETEPGKFKASIRSKNYLDVAKICKNLGGGGHVRAAGCYMYGDFQKVVSDISSALIQAMGEV